ncbi:hypothetical protein SAMN05421671_3251 [Pimelobacter simplex]|nr:hypothetical protein NSI01_51920 [Pimelobacter simplex]SFM73972.1 hypothetical protein SAMN05421671_3251 [Pimelobacter simplex]
MTRYDARPLVRADWAWVQAWFTDATLDRELGPLDEEWLEHVLADQEGVELVVTDCGGAAVALVGVAWDPDGATHGITDLAVDPARTASTASLSGPAPRARGARSGRAARRRRGGSVR